MISSYRRLWSGYLRTHWRAMVVVLILMAIGAAVSAAYAKFVQVLIERMEARDLGFLVWAPVLIIALTAVKGASFFGQMVLIARFMSSAEARLQGDMYARLVSTDLAHLQTEPPAATAARFSADVGAVRGASEAILNGVSNVLIVVATFLVMLSINWSLTLGLIGIFVAAAIPVYWIGRVVRSTSREVQTEIARMTSEVNEGLSGIRLVRTYRLENRLVAMAGQVFDRLRAQKVRLKSWMAGIEPMMEIVGGIAFAALLALVAWQMGAGSGSLADFMGLLTGMAVASTPARRLGSIYASAQAGAAALERVWDLLDRRDTILDPKDPSRLERSRGGVTFRDVSFAYPDGTPALIGFDLDIAPGEKIAFVGRSGAGKSTVFNLLPRLYDATGGEVLIDGQPIRSLTLSDLRDQIALVSQDSVLLTGSVADNIAFGREGANREAVEAAAKAAEAAGFIEALPRGYDTEIVPSEASFSGGERQRISIARAILRDAPILMLDEPTSALDAQSERAIKLALDRLSEGRTTLIIAHRLTTVRDADRIVVMDAGRIADIGSHDDLLARGGIYAELYALQTGAD